MWKFLQVRKGRKAAFAAISPFVEDSRRRLGGIDDDIWLTPYMVGFMATLITLVAQRTISPISSDALGLIQAEAWARITGLNGELIGEEISFLSSGENKDFAAGCRDAAAFLDALMGEPIREATEAWQLAMTSTVIGANPGVNFDELNPGALALWSLYFDGMVMQQQRMPKGKFDA
ncbi:MAG TPA: hypothetical protein VNL39_01480 [Xanthobacteraceae bacterium]|nr:hypothetical protein [Xanthobacteraceae bacterium]